MVRKRLVGSVCEYHPGIMDKTDPRVIEGRPIKPGSTVIVTKVPDPVGRMAWIRDEHGNEQSVWSKALIKCRKRRRG